jgi:hypothetical protein
MRKSSAAVSMEVISEEGAAEAPRLPLKATNTGADPWIVIWAEELEQAYRLFAREASRLARLAQRKKKVPVPSEAFNQLLAGKMEDVEKSFQLYVRRKQELLTYLHGAARRSESLEREKRHRMAQVDEAESHAAKVTRAAS